MDQPRSRSPSPAPPPSPYTAGGRAAFPGPPPAAAAPSEYMVRSMGERQPPRPVAEEEDYRDNRPPLRVEAAPGTPPGGMMGGAVMTDDYEISGGVNSAVDNERRIEAARRAAQEVSASLERKRMDPNEEGGSQQQGGMHMGVCIHWSGIRGFGILRSQGVGEVFVHAKSLGNASELTVGDVVTFELGFDRKKQKPEAINCFRAGVGGAAGGFRPPSGRENTELLALEAPVKAIAAGPTSSLGGGAAALDDSVLADAAAAAALKLLARGLGGAGESASGRRGGRSASRSLGGHDASGSRRHSPRRSARRSSRRRSRSRRRTRDSDHRHRR
uniref:CSD domain-containing protein n=1 Tax=Alexandrium monilatum TaxID=311494 RepID=A0A7S4VUP3_9DINO